MPKRTDFSRILVIGSGPIVIGQACEFDYSGTQACQALKQEGYKVVLVNSNPATIMTDPEIADVTYIEPLTIESVKKIIHKEQIQAILPTLGGQTALNLALKLDKSGFLQQQNVELIGAKAESIEKAENRAAFNQAMHKIGLKTPESWIVHSLNEALEAGEKTGFPCIVRPSFTLGGTGGGIAHDNEELQAICKRGLELSMNNEVQIDKSLLGWKEFEMEVVRDKLDNAIIVCAIENLDPMGIHTGDSITVAPAQTLSDKEYQRMRDASLAVLREIGIETGGSNVQFATNPETGEMIVIEMNPRVSRSSALASKVTGFPIAKIATKLAIGYSLDELSNDMTGGITPASFEPSIDYVVTKIPRFTFDKFPSDTPELSSQMKSVGEAMAFGNHFLASIQKALCSLEEKWTGFDELVSEENGGIKALMPRLGSLHYRRIFYVADAFRLGLSLEEVYEITKIDRWFLHQIHYLVKCENSIRQRSLASLESEEWQELKWLGLSDARLAKLLQASEEEVATARRAFQVLPVYKRVDSCAGEFDTPTAYLYSCYHQDGHCEARVEDKKKIAILGSGPNRIGQGIEFDYCCVHASWGIKAEGYQSIMINCNPETVSTDYDTSDRLYFEPITYEYILEILHKEQPYGVILQFGGQTPLKLSQKIADAGFRILGTNASDIARAEDRELFRNILEELELKQPKNAIAYHQQQALDEARIIGYPLLVRPSFVLGGRGMQIVYSDQELSESVKEAMQVEKDQAILLDKFLPNAIEVDVDLISDGKKILVGGLLEHIEQAGIHSGDSACSMPPATLSQSLIKELEQKAKALGERLGVVGLMNIQLAIQDDEIYVIEANPRASRTVPFISKVIGTSLAKLGTQCLLGRKLEDLGFESEAKLNYFSIKEVVMPFNKFLASDPILGPEMRSTGEVMGSDVTFAKAFAKATLAAGTDVSFLKSATKRVFVSVKDSDKPQLKSCVEKLIKQDFAIYCTHGTKDYLANLGFAGVQAVNKVHQGTPHIVDMILAKDIDMIINTTEGYQSIQDSRAIRRAAIDKGVFLLTTLASAKAFLQAIDHLDDLQPYSLGDLHAGRVS